MTTPKPVKIARIPIVIYTPRHRIEGTYYAPAGSRISDHLNWRRGQQEFIALTDVKVANLQDEDQIVFESDFLTVNMNSIMLLSPKPTGNGGLT